MIGKITGTVVVLAVGLALAVIGLLIWKKQMISLIHEYHYTKVSKKDVAPYTRLMGVALIVLGAGIAAAGALIFLAGSNYGFALAVLAFIAFFVISGRAQKKYNGSWF